MLKLEHAVEWFSTLFWSFLANGVFGGNLALASWMIVETNQLYFLSKFLFKMKSIWSWQIKQKPRKNQVEVFWQIKLELRSLLVLRSFWDHKNSQIWKIICDALESLIVFDALSEITWWFRDTFFGVVNSDTNKFCLMIQFSTKNYVNFLPNSMMSSCYGRFHEEAENKILLSRPVFPELFYL